MLLRVVALIVGVLFLRDGYAGLQGTQLLITKGYTSIVFNGWKGRLAGAFLILSGLVLLWIAWRGIA